MNKLFRTLFCAALALIATSTRAHAADGRWLRIESEHFIFYSEVGDRLTREGVRTLELYDAELRVTFTAQPRPTRRKLEVYLLRNQESLQEVEPGVTSLAWGFYSPASQRIAAFVVYSRVLGPAAQQFLFHEYAHHFMLQSTSAPYPGWFVEGFAEYAQTIRFEQNQAVIGDYSILRTQDILSDEWPPIAEFLAPDHAKWTGQQEVRFYAEAWVAVHYLMEDPARMAAFQTYLDGLSHGADPVTSFEPAFHMTPAAFETALHAHAHGQIQRYGSPLPNVHVGDLPATHLPRGADDLLLLRARLEHGVPQEQRAALATQIERIASRNPNDAFAQRVRAEALILRGAFADARTVLQAQQAAAPTDAEPPYLIGYSYVREAWAAPPEQRAAIAEQGRRYFVQAFHIDSEHAPTLYNYALTYQFTDAPMPDSALDVLLRAYQLAPQVREIGMDAAYALMRRERFDDAQIILRPIAYAPHESGDTSFAQTLLESAEHHERPDNLFGKIANQEEDAADEQPAPGDAEAPTRRRRRH